MISILLFHRSNGIRINRGQKVSKDQIELGLIADVPMLLGAAPGSPQIGRYRG